MKDPTERARFAFRTAAAALKELGRTPEEIELGLKDLGEKCGMDMPMAASPWQPYAGATSFDELDRWAVGQEMREQYDQLNWQLRNLMSNILDAPDLEVTDRAAAITSLAEEFATRAEQIPSDVADDMDVNLDDLEDDPETASGEADDSADPPSRLTRWLRGLKAAGEATPAAGAAAGATKKKLPPWLMKGKGKKKAGAAAGAKDGMPPAFGDVGTFSSTKDHDGNWRWLAVYSNRYYDREGEVFPERSHKDYLEWADQDPAERYPELWDWHTPVGLGATGGKGLGMGRADVLDYQDGLAIAAGYWYPEFNHAAEHYADMKDIGISHGYDYAPSAKQADGSYKHFFTFEISPLPRERAANDITLFLPAAGTKEALMNIRPDRRAHLVGVHGEQYVKDLETRLGGVADKLAASGLSFKDLDAVFAGATPDSTQPSAAGSAAPGISVPPAAAGADGATAQPTPEAFAAAVKDTLAPAIGAAISTALAPILTRLDAVEQGAKDLHAPRIMLDLTKSPSNSEATIQDGRTAMVRAANAGHKDEGPNGEQPDDGGLGWYARNGLFGPPATAAAAAPVFGDDFITAAIAAAGN